MQRRYPDAPPAVAIGTRAGEGRAVGVLGSIEPDQLGVVLPHEHLTVDNRVHLDDSGEHGEDGPLLLENLAQARIAPRSISRNIVLDDDAAITAALARYRAAGGCSLVELTPIAMGRDLARCRAISAASGVNVVAATGYYVARGHGGRVAGRSEQDIADELVRELTEPVDGITRCGVIGEIGISHPHHPDELRVLAAALRAQQLTGAPIWVHVTGRRPVPALLDVLEAYGVDLSRVVIAHLDYDLRDLGDHRRALSLGLVVEFDLFGFPVWTSGNFMHSPTDTQRVEALLELAGAGFAEQLLVSHDVCMKTQLPAWGGFGYTHLVEHVLPVLEDLGGDATLIEQLCRLTPRRLLCWDGAASQPAGNSRGGSV